MIGTGKNRATSDKVKDAAALPPGRTPRCPLDAVIMASRRHASIGDQNPADAPEGKNEHMARELIQWLPRR